MKISLDDMTRHIGEKRTSVGYFILNTITPEAIEKAKESKEYDIEFKINGVEYDFASVVDKLFKQFDYQVKKEAERIIQSRIDNVIWDFEKRATEFQNWILDRVKYNG